MADDVPIATAIRELRAQLEAAQMEGTGKALRFLAKSVEVELSIVYKSGTEGGGGFKAWFLDLSAKATSGQESTHKLKLVLEPVGPDGTSVLVRDGMLEQSTAPSRAEPHDRHR
jgi:hypothetical protein